MPASAARVLRASDGGWGAAKDASERPEDLQKRRHSGEAEGYGSNTQDRQGASDGGDGRLMTHDPTVERAQQAAVLCARFFPAPCPPWRTAVVPIPSFPLQGRAEPHWQDLRRRPSSRRSPETGRARRDTTTRAAQRTGRCLARRGHRMGACSRAASEDVSQGPPENTPGAAPALAVPPRSRYPLSGARVPCTVRSSSKEEPR